MGLVGASSSPNYLYYWKPDSAGAAPSFFVYPFTIDGQPANLPSDAQAGFNPVTRSLVIFGGGAFFAEPPQTRVMVMQDAPVILQQPINVVVMPGTPATLRAAVSGGRDGLSFQWQRNGQPITNDARISGANTPTLRFQPAQAADTGNYQLVVMNSCATVTSTEARLAVGPVLNAARIGENLQLTWTASGVIVEEASDLAGPWTPHADWTSPRAVAIGNGSHFFRLKTTGP